MGALLQKGFRVRVLVRKTSNLQWLQGLPLEFVTGEFHELGTLRESVRGVDYVFHLAGAIHAFSKRDYLRANTEATQTLAQAVSEVTPHLKKFIFVSSQAAGGPSLQGRAVSEEDSPHPVSFYGESKLAAEKVLLGFSGNLPLVILRPPTIYGPRETRVLTAFKMMKWRFALAAGFKPKLLSLCYVKDLVTAILQAAFQSHPSGRIYNVVGQRPYEWLELIEAIARAMRRPRYAIFRLPSAFLFSAGLIGEIYSRLTHRPTIFTWQKVREFVQNSWVIDGTRIQRELGWRERVTLEEGIAETVQWYQREKWL